MKYREITLNDTPAIFELRIATNENNFTYEELEARGITHVLLQEKLLRSCKGWLCEINNEIIGFAIADKKAANIWALAVLPVYNKKLVAANLQNLAEHWLLSCGKSSFHPQRKRNNKFAALSVA